MIREGSRHPYVPGLQNGATPRTRATLRRGAGLLATGLPVNVLTRPIAVLRSDLFGCDAGSRAAQMSALRSHRR
jgi:hypothetical protein